MPPKRRRNQPPVLHAALLFLAPWMFFQVLGSIFFHSFPNILSAANLVIYILNGYFAAGFYSQMVHNDRRLRQNCIRNGAAAGLTLCIGGWILFAFLMLFLSFFTSSLGWAYGSSIVCWGPTDVLAALLLGALGGSMNSRR